MNDKMKAGVIIGRFQVPYLEDPNIFTCVLDKKFDSNIVIIGIPPDSIRATKNNPLDFDARRRMIDEKYPGKFDIYYIKDEKDDNVWDNKLDAIIDKVAKNYEVTLFGTSECALKYHGKYNFIIFESNKRMNSEMLVRELAGKKTLSDEAWRAGAVWATQNRYDTVFPTVDCCIFDNGSVWMGKKSYENKLRFIGGFVSPTDRSYEEAAIREAEEETGLKCQVMDYICSHRVDDWRYKKETDKVITTFFALDKFGGIPKAGDDIAEIHKVNLLQLSENDIVDEHIPLLGAAQNWYKDMVDDMIEREN